MACKKFNIDPLSQELKGAVPSAFTGVSEKVKAFDINETFNTALPDIKSKVASAVENFKNIKTGSLPSLNLPKFDPAGFFEEIDKKVDNALTSLTDIKAKLTAEKNKANGILNSQLDCVQESTTSLDEVAVSQGDIFANIKGDVGSLSNNQLRDFNLSEENQIAAVNDITANTVERGKVAAAKGVTNVKQADNQLKSLSNRALGPMSQSELDLYFGGEAIIPERFFNKLVRPFREIITESSVDYNGTYNDFVYFISDMEDFAGYPDTGGLYIVLKIYIIYTVNNSKPGDQFYGLTYSQAFDLLSPRHKGKYI